MAKYIGMLPFRGTLDGITCCKTKHGIIMKQKSSITKERVMKAPEYRRTRENISEFATAAKSNKLIRMAARELVLNAKDPTLITRLMKEVLPVLKADPVNPRGRRSLQDGPVERLKGFNMNSKAIPASIPIEVNISRQHNLVLINLPLFVPLSAIAFPKGATHYKLVTAVSEIDFNAEQLETTCKETEVMPLDKKPVLPMTRSHSIGNSRQIIFVFFGIQFYKKYKSGLEPFGNGSSNPLSIIEINKP